jgi:hypothetical protein
MSYTSRVRVMSALAVKFDGGLGRRFEFAFGVVHLAGPREVRSPVVDALRGALFDRRPAEFVERTLERVGVDRFLELDGHAVGLRGVEFLDPFDHLVGRQVEVRHLYLAVGEVVYFGFEGVDIDGPAARFVDLDDERPPAFQHERVHVLAASAVEGSALAVHRRSDRRRGELLDALVVAVARAITPLADLAAIQSGAVAVVAGPLRLGDVPLQFAVAPVDERRVDVGVEFVAPEVEGDLHVRAAKVHLGVGRAAEALAHLAVEFGFQLLARVRV